MYKKFKQYALNKGLIVEEKNELAYGQFNGLFISITQDPQTPACHTVELWVKQENTMPVPAIVDFLNQCTQKYKYLRSAAYNGAKITAELQGLGFQWWKKYVPCLDAFLQELTAYCRNNGLIQCCESCDTQYGLSLYQIAGQNHLLCSPCYAQKSSELKQTLNQKIKRSNVVGGIVGALLGSLIGVAVWVLIYQLGYISAIAGAVMVICALKGYELLGGSLSRTGVIISCLISLFMVLFAEQLSLGIEIYQVYKDYYEITFFDSFRSVPSFLSDPEIMMPVAGDLIIGYLLMALGAWGTIRQAYKTTAGHLDTRLVTSVTDASITAGINEKEVC